MTAKLTFYGGVNEIGGNKILLQTEDGSVLLDFGRRIGEYGKFFSEFLVARSKNALRDMLRLGILPKIDDIYTPYLVDMTVLFENEAVSKKVPLNEALDYWKTTDVCPCNPEHPAVDGVFVSHAHFDHIQDVSFLDPCIPVYCTEKTKVIAKAMTDVSVSGVDDQYYKIAKKVTIKQKAPLFKTSVLESARAVKKRKRNTQLLKTPKPNSNSPTTLRLSTERLSRLLRDRSRASNTS